MLVSVAESGFVTEYEAEAWETGTRHSDETGYESKAHSQARSQAPRSRPESPHTYNQASQSGDYYRDTNITYNNSSNPNLRLGGSQQSHSNMSHQNHMQQPAMSQYGAPQIPFMPFGGGPGSAAGSDYGHMMTMPPQLPQMGYQNTGSMYGMVPPAMAPRNTMMTGMNMFDAGSVHGSQSGAIPPFMGMQQRPTSTFSMGTSANPFSGPSMNPNPTDEDLFNALRNYLSTQDLMSVTKKFVFFFKFLRAFLGVEFTLLMFFFFLLFQNRPRGDYISVPQSGPGFAQRLFESVHRQNTFRIIDAHPLSLA
jgi:chitin synthase